MDRMGQAKLIGRIGQRFQNGARTDATRGQGFIQSVEVPLTGLPCLDTAWIHDLDRVGSG
jgi:hypothetical protein